MHILVQNQITGEPKLADVEVDDLKIQVKLVDEPIEFTCEPVSKYTNKNELEYIFSEKHKDWTIGLFGWRILNSNVPYVQDTVVDKYDFVNEFKLKYLSKLGECNETNAL